MTINELRRLIDEARDALQMPDNPPYCPVEMIDRTPNDAYATEQPRVDRIDAGQAEVGTRASSDGAFSTS